MEDYRKKIIDGVLSNSMYKEVSKDLPEDQKKKIQEHLAKFVDEFSMNMIRTFSAAAQQQTRSKTLEIPSGSVITKENG